VSDVTSRGIVQYLGDYWEMRDLEMTEKCWENIAKGAAFEGGRGGPLNGVWEQSMQMSQDLGLGFRIGYG